MFLTNFPNNVRSINKIDRGAVVAEWSRAELHGTGFAVRIPQVPSIFEAGSHQFSKPSPNDLKPGPINFKDPPHLEEMTSGEEMESRESRWKVEVPLADLMRIYSAYKRCINQCVMKH